MNKALRIQPDFGDAQFNIGCVLQEQRKLAEAAASYQHAARLKPGFAEVYYNLGLVLWDQGKLEEAVASFQQAIHLEPGHAMAYHNLGVVFKQHGQYVDAEACLNQSLRLNPDNAEAYLNLGNVFKAQGRLDDTISAYRTALRLKPDAAYIHSNLILSFHYHPDYDATAYFEECQRWNQRHAEPLKPLIRPHTNLPEPERKLRIGYVSPDFREHVDSFFLIPLLANHDREQCEIFCYSNVTNPDHLTERIRGYADVWRSTVRVPDEQVAEMIRNDQIDILVDLELHIANNRLLVFARKPAPVQVSWLGYPGTTGLSTIDYRLTDPYLDPPGLLDTCYSEESIRLPDTFWCYDPLTDGPEVGALPAIANGYVTFGCLNAFCKINDKCLSLWAQVLRAVPNSRLLLRVPRDPARDRVLATLQHAGIAASRVEFVRTLPRLEYLKTYQRIDCCLDPVPCNGHTTSLDAFWMGVPTITLVSKTTAFGRAGWSQLSNLSLTELAADTPEEYVARAAQLAADLPRLQELRGTLRERLQNSPLMDGKRFALQIEQVYRQMWRRWCRQKNHSTVYETTSSAPPAEPQENNTKTVSISQMMGKAWKCHQAGQWKEAEQLYLRILQKAANHIDALHFMGLLASQTNRLDLAIANLEAVVRLQPLFAEAHGNLGYALLQKERLRDAEASLREALRLKPNLAQAHLESRKCVFGTTSA